MIFQKIHSVLMITPDPPWANTRELEDMEDCIHVAQTTIETNLNTLDENLNRVSDAYVRFLNLNPVANNAILPPQHQGAAAPERREKYKPDITFLRTRK